MLPFLPIENLFYLFGIKLSVWGIFALISAITFISIYYENIKYYRLDYAHAIKLLIHFGVWTLVGFHLYHILFVSHEYNRIFDMTAGVDSFGVVLGIAALIIYMSYYKLDLRYLDAIALPVIALATVQRISDLLISDKVGVMANLPWSIYAQGALRHPIGLYYFLVSLPILFIMIKLSKKKMKQGNLFLWASLLYCPTRFLIEFFRAIPPHIYYGLSVHQIAFGMLFIVTIIFYYYNNKYNKKYFIPKK